MALLKALFTGNLETVGCLIQVGADVNAKDKLENTAIIHASAQGHTDCLELLIKSGADVNSYDSEGNTVLMLTAQQGHTECNSFAFNEIILGCFANQSLLREVIF